MGTQYLRSNSGQFAGSIGTGKTTVPTIADIPEPFRPHHTVENLPNTQREGVLRDAYSAWQAHERRDRLDRVKSLWVDLPDGLDSWAFWNATDKMEYGEDPVPEDSTEYDAVTSQTMLQVDQFDIVTDERGETVGFVSRETIAGETGSVDVDMWVHPAYRGSYGHEQRIVRDYTDEIERNGVTGVHYVHPHVNNTALQNALTQEGWVRCEDDFFSPRTQVYPAYSYVIR